MQKMAMGRNALKSEMTQTFRVDYNCHAWLLEIIVYMCACAESKFLKHQSQSRKHILFTVGRNKERKH